MRNGAGERPAQGDPRPRIFTCPPYVTSAAAEAIECAASAGLVLDEWEAWMLTQALGERRDGKWSAFEIGLICSRQNGKTAIIEARLLAGLFLFKEQLLIYTAHEFKTAGETFIRLRRLVEQTPWMDAKVAKIPESHGEEGIELISGQRLRILARSGTSGRGFSCDCLVYDEAMILDSADAGASVPTLSAREHVTPGGPQVWYSASAGERRSTQLALVRRRGHASEDGSLCFAEWSIDPHSEYCDPGCSEHDDPEDPRSVAKANPGLGHVHADGTGLTWAAVDRERKALDDDAYGRERLGVGIYPAPADGWAVIPRRWWDATLMPDSARPSPAVCAIAATPHQRAAAIAVAGPRPDERMGVEIARHQGGTAWLLPEVYQVDRRWHPLGWVIDPRGGAGFLVPKLQEAGLNVLTPNATQIGHGCAEFYNAVRDDQLRHANDRDAQSALAAADRRKLGNQWVWDQSDPDLDMSTVIALTLAHWGAVQLAAEDYDIAESVHFDLDEILRLCRKGVYGPQDIARLYSEDLIDDDGLTWLAAQDGVRMPPLAALMREGAST